MSYKLSDSTFREPMTCSQAEIAMLQHMETTISLKDARRLAQHVQDCESCREYYLAFDEIMECTAAETESSAYWQEAPESFTAAVMTKVHHMPVHSKPEVVEEIKRSGLVTLHILWGASAILFGIALFFAFNPDSFTNLINSFPIFDSIVTSITGFGASLSQALTNMRYNHTIESSLGIAALLFVLILGSLLVVLHKDAEQEQRL